MGITLIIVGGIILVTMIAAYFDYRGKVAATRGTQPQQIDLEARIESLEHALADRDKRLRSLEQDMMFMWNLSNTTSACGQCFSRAARYGCRIAITPSLIRAVFSAPGQVKKASKPSCFRSCPPTQIGSRRSKSLTTMRQPSFPTVTGQRTDPYSPTVVFPAGRLVTARTSAPYFSLRSRSTMALGRSGCSWILDSIRKPGMRYRSVKQYQDLSD